MGRTASENPDAARRIPEQRREGEKAAFCALRGGSPPDPLRARGFCPDGARFPGFGAKKSGPPVWGAACCPLPRRASGVFFRPGARGVCSLLPRGGCAALPCARDAALRGRRGSRKGRPCRGIPDAEGAKRGGQATKACPPLSRLPSSARRSPASELLCAGTGAHSAHSAHSARISDAISRSISSTCGA